MATDFTCPRQLLVSLVDDPDSVQGKAVKSAHHNPDLHGVDKVMPGEHKFRTTQFVIGTVGPNIETFLKEIPQDEKYHWYRIPGSIEFKERSNFWTRTEKTSRPAEKFWRNCLASMMSCLTRPLVWSCLSGWLAAESISR
ncbi:MAG: hypothetical protein IJJ33_01005 [Victivallales bacterium]|nr:hypothetical protein [Victivallales bacterium]